MSLFFPHDSLFKFFPPAEGLFTIFFLREAFSKFPGGSPSNFFPGEGAPIFSISSTPHIINGRPLNRECPIHSLKVALQYAKCYTKVYGGVG